MINISKSRGGLIRFNFHTGGLYSSVNTGATIKIMDNNGTTSSFSTPITAAAVTFGPSTTLTAAATAGNRTLQLRSATSFVRGQTILVGPNASGQKENAIVEFVVTGSTHQLKLLRDLKYSYAATAGVVDPEITYNLTAGDATILDFNSNHIAQWTFTVGSHTYKDRSYFNVVPQVLRSSVMASDLIAYDRRLEEIDTEDIQRCIGAAFKEIEQKIRIKDKKTGLVIDTDLLFVPLRDIALSCVYRMLGSRSGDDVWDMKAVEAGLRGREGLEETLNHIPYDWNENLVVEEGEEDTNMGNTFLTM